ncbi:MAG: prolipoprotein diacylglyceryl transferase, partial [Pseudomonadota bacterium]
MFEFVALDFPGFSPFIFTIPRIELGGFGIGPLPLRWYAVSWIVGIMLAFAYGNRLVEKPALYGGKTPPVTREDMDEIFVWSLLGMILGGRIGYVLFYLLPFAPERVLSDPLSLIRIWDGGLSFHGGFIGACLAVFLVARARKVPLLSFADIGAMISPIAFFMVRIFGNFMNAELYGRHTDGALGMIFPEGIAPNASGPPAAWDTVEKAWVYAGTELPRHPSQIYEGILEGLVPALVLALLAFRHRILEKPGMATGLLFVMYGIGRSIAENFREPDAHIGFLPGQITMGMLLSAP